MPSCQGESNLWQSLLFSAHRIVPYNVLWGIFGAQIPQQLDSTLIVYLAYLVIHSEIYIYICVCRNKAPGTGVFLQLLFVALRRALRRRCKVKKKVDSVSVYRWLCSWNAFTFIQSWHITVPSLQSTQHKHTQTTISLTHSLTHKGKWTLRTKEIASNSCTLLMLSRCICLFLLAAGAAQREFVSTLHRDDSFFFAFAFAFHCVRSVCFFFFYSLGQSEKGRKTQRSLARLPVINRHEIIGVITVRQAPTSLCPAWEIVVEHTESNADSCNKHSASNDGNQRAQSWLTLAIFGRVLFGFGVVASRRKYINRSNSFFLCAMRLCGSRHNNARRPARNMLAYCIVICDSTKRCWWHLKQCLPSLTIEPVGGWGQIGHKHSASHWHFADSLASVTLCCRVCFVCVVVWSSRLIWEHCQPLSVPLVCLLEEYYYILRKEGRDCSDDIRPHFPCATKSPLSRLNEHTNPRKYKSI